MTQGFRYFENAGDYDFGCPEGEWAATLDHKAWGKKQNLILYFTEHGSGAKYWLSVFFDKGYGPRDKSLSFEESEQGEVFILTTSRTKTGNPVIESARRAKGGGGTGSCGIGASRINPYPSSKKT